jgi:hypothetical protein
MKEAALLCWPPFEKSVERIVIQAMPVKKAGVKGETAGRLRSDRQREERRERRREDGEKREERREKRERGDRDRELRWESTYESNRKCVCNNSGKRPRDQEEEQEIDPKSERDESARAIVCVLERLCM